MGAWAVRHCPACESVRLNPDMADKKRSAVNNPNARPQATPLPWRCSQRSGGLSLIEALERCMRRSFCIIMARDRQSPALCKSAVIQRNCRACISKLWGLSAGFVHPVPACFISANYRLRCQTGRSTSLAPVRECAAAATAALHAGIRSVCFVENSFMSELLLESLIIGSIV